MSVCLFVLLLYVLVNSYGHYGKSVHLTTLFFWASLNKLLTSTSCTTFPCNWQKPFLNDSFSGREENDRRNYFMIHLHESIGPDRERTWDPWICSQTCIVTNCPTQPGISESNKNQFSYLSTKTYVVGSHKNRLNVTVLLSTQNIYVKIDG